MDIDISRLRSDLEDYYGSAAFSGFPAALVELSQRAGLDLNDYEA